MKTSKILLGIVVIVIITIGAIILTKLPSSKTSSPADTSMKDIDKQTPDNTPFVSTDTGGNVVLGDSPIPETIANAQIFKMSIKNNAFVSNSDSKPLSGFLPSPTKVVWTNNDSVSHTVTFDDGSAGSGEIKPGKSFSFYFTKPGTYEYYCSYHPNMKGSISIK